MLKEITATLRWSVILGARFFQIYPLGIIAIVSLTFLAQLALIASLLLPLKIVMIMSTGKIPDIFPPAMTQYGDHSLVAAISAVAIGAFLFNNLATKKIDKLGAKSAAKLQLQTNKLALFENQDALTKNAILKFSAILASLLFVSVGLVILVQLYWLLAAVTVGFVLACIIFYSLIWERVGTWLQAVEDKFKPHLNMLGNIGFLTVFIAIVADYIVSSIPSFLSVLLSIVLSRQIFSQLTTAIFGARFLNIHQHKLQALAFDHHVLQTTTKKSSRTVWGFLENTQQRSKLCDYVQQCINSQVTARQLNWLDSGLSHILHFTIDSHNSKRYLVKIFNKDKSAKARHEATLLLDQPSGLPCPPLIDKGTIDGFHVHIFDVSCCELILSSTNTADSKKIELTLHNITPPKVLITQYQRSRPMLWDRIDGKMINRICAVAEELEEENVEDFIAQLPSLKEKIKLLPLAIYKEVSNEELLCIKENGEITAIDWTDWSIDPIDRDARYCSGSKSQAPLDIAFFEIEKQFNNQCYRSALNTAINLIKNYSASE